MGRKVIKIDAKMKNIKSKKDSSFYLYMDDIPYIEEKVCIYCRSTENLEYVQDPWEMYHNEVDTFSWMCKKCINQSKRDVKNKVPYIIDTESQESIFMRKQRGY